MQPRFRPCPECGGRRVLTHAKVEDPLKFNVEPHIVKLWQLNRKSGWFDRRNESEVCTLTCTQCGYTAWYALTPQNLIPGE